MLAALTAVALSSCRRVRTRCNFFMGCSLGIAPTKRQVRPLPTARSVRWLTEEPRYFLDRIDSDNSSSWGATAGGDRKMNNEPLQREPIDCARARLEALLKANAAPRCGARSKRTGKPCRGAAMPNGRCKLHGGKSKGPRTPEGLERSRRANWKHGHFSREAKAERSRVRAAILALRYLCGSI